MRTRKRGTKSLTTLASFAQRSALGAERIGRNDFSASKDVVAMDGAHHVGAGQQRIRRPERQPRRNATAQNLAARAAIEQDWLSVLLSPVEKFTD